ncbi:hypothetical protein Smp_144640 [Schistosoma mansoni]|uniref:hypothetical protein n=1 Tax=Schistosoma mansoni TaxID=6183 RepID=UPI0001A63906|nr:hypothetical protein Smp_144640 [Schistosoma mansoni]|eukprot:XP_018645734.1 hypothetical protein Smp_144640 [Schistosoma mansoni]
MEVGLNSLIIQRVPLFIQSLKCVRNNIHTHLMIAILLRASSWICLALINTTTLDLSKHLRLYTKYYFDQDKPNNSKLKTCHHLVERGVSQKFIFKFILAAYVMQKAKL